MLKFATAVSTVKMHFSHEKHQYYFEKYLRKEMKGEEFASFERKLAEDENFNKAFAHYVRNRKEIVEEDLAEYDLPELLIEKPQKWGWVYTSISLLCIVLIVDYYLSSNYNSGNDHLNKREPLIEKINIFRSKPVTKEVTSEKSKDSIGGQRQQVIPDVYPTDTAALLADVDAQLIQYMEGNRLAIQGDYFVADSLFKVVESKFLLERTNSLRIQTDSLLDDSSLHVLVVKSLFKNVAQFQRTFLVEFWESPIHFRGYLFNGKKLLLYGIDPNDPLMLSYLEENSTYHLFIGSKEFQLFSDNQFHKLAEE